MTGTPRRTCLASIVLAVAVLLTACGGDDETADDTTTTTTPERAPTTEPEAPTSTEAADDEPPELENTGEDFEAIVRSINDYENWLFQNPDPALLEKYTDPACSCFEEERAKLQTLVDNGWEADGPQASLSRTEVEDRPSEDQVTIEIMLEFLNTAIIDQEQVVVQRSPEGPPERFLIALLRTGEAWRITDVEPLGE